MKQSITMVVAQIQQVFAAGRHEDAKQQALKAVPHFPDSFYLHNLIGGVSSMQHQKDEALHYLTLAVKLEPKNPDGLVNLGNAQRISGHLEKAKATLKKATKIVPNAAEAWNNLGMVYVDMNSRSNGMYAFHKALALKPGHPSILLNIFIEYDRDDDLDAMEKTVENEQKSGNKNLVVDLFQGILWSRLAQDQQAVDRLSALDFSSSNAQQIVLAEQLRVRYLGVSSSRLGDVATT